jgi:hypothetical protein
VRGQQKEEWGPNSGLGKSKPTCAPLHSSGDGQVEEDIWYVSLEKTNPMCEDLNLDEQPHSNHPPLKKFVRQKMHVIRSSTLHDHPIRSEAIPTHQLHKCFALVRLDVKMTYHQHVSRLQLPTLLRSASPFAKSQPTMILFWLQQTILRASNCNLNTLLLLSRWLTGAWWVWWWACTCACA